MQTRSSVNLTRWRVSSPAKGIGGRHTTSQTTGATFTKHLCSLAHSLSHRGFIQQPEHCQADWTPRHLIVPGEDHGIGVPSILVEGSDCGSIESSQLLMELEQISYVGTECDQDGVRDRYKLLDKCAYM